MAKETPKDPKTYALKLGQSFDKKSDVSYHTMRFDFMPVSLGSSKDLTMNVGGEGGSEVTATITGKPGNSSSQSSQSVFKGSTQDYSAKECVLIIDELTGEVTLERLGANVRLKRLRPEKPEGRSGGQGRSDKMDISPSSTPDYSPLGSSSPTPSPSQPVNPVPPVQPSAKSKINKLPTKADPKPPAKVTAAPKPVPAYQAPKPAIPENPRPPRADIIPEIGEISASSSSSSSGSDSSSSSDSENDMDDLLESVGTQPAAKTAPTAAPPAQPVAPSRSSVPVNNVLHDHLKTTSDEEGSDEDDIFRF